MPSRYEHPFIRWLNRWVLRPRVLIAFFAFIAMMEIVTLIFSKRILP